MRALRVGLLIIAWIGGGSAVAAPAAPDAIAGFWQTQGGEAIIHIRAEHGRFPGTIAWLAEQRYPADDPKGMGGQAVVDRYNPDPAQRDRPLIGMQMIKNLHYHVLDNQQARWQDGRIYDSERGKWYDFDAWLADRNHLKIRGYIGIRLLGRTTTWTRVPDPADKPPSSTD